jgi:hypothetical protein
MMDTFSIPYKYAHESTVSFKTDIDGEYSAHEQRNSLWTNPRRTWVLDFEKTPAAFSAVSAFFIAQKGRWKAFSWTWKQYDDNGRYLGGDGNTYTVRFDVDDLDFKINRLGYKTFSLTLVEVVTSE